MTAIGLFVISATVLALELVLLRAFSIGHWYHFSYLIISTALLGFGAGGTFVSIFSERLAKKPLSTMWSLALGMALTVPIVFYFSQKIPLDELQLIWDRRQILYIFAYYLLFFIPFFFGAGCIALIFSVYGSKAHRLYFYNMTGSGLGVAVAIALMYGNSPQRLLLAVSAAAYVAAVIFALKISPLRVIMTLICAGLCVCIFSPFGPLPLTVKISRNKSLVYYQAVPDAHTLAVLYSPLGRLDCIKAPSVRYFPGLSIAYDGDLPQQMLIISDADGISAVNSFADVNDLRCYRHTTSALAYHLVDKPEVCIIGSGGGSDVVQAIAFGSAHITAVEMNPRIIDLVQGTLSEYAGRIYEKDNVEPVIAEGRSYLETTGRKFDIVGISLLDSFTAAAAGTYALNESHLYTVESVERALEALKPRGLLSITRVIKLPPRDSLKMLATITEALMNQGITEPSQNIAMIRGWSTATIIASLKPLSQDYVNRIRRFADDNSFDLVHVPGITAEKANRFDVLDDPIYYNAAERILSPDRAKFYYDYSYNIRPATDDKPYFFDFFKLRALPHMIKSLGRRWLIFSEWGYLVLVITLLQAIVASAVLIVLPLWLSKSLRAVRSGKFVVLSFFLLLGLAYMFLEMGFIQKMTLLTGRPVFGVAVTLVGFLVFSGLGSLTAGRLSRVLKRPCTVILFAVTLIILLAAANILCLKFFFGWLVGFSSFSRILWGLIFIGPLAFFMGMPFPTALKRIHSTPPPLLPWAWGVNGFASVIAAVLGTLLAISVGFTILAFVSLLCYLFAAALSAKLLVSR